MKRLLKETRVNFIVLGPLLFSAQSAFLIEDIDSPRGGVIRVQPENLASLVESLRAP